MYLAFLFAGLMAAYLAGSINFAIPVSRWAGGIDIRSVGTGNPGTANVGREVGRKWAALVLLGDLTKGLVPLILARVFLFQGEGLSDNSALFLMGMAAITGHCWPVYHQFRGGGGLATSIGIYMFFIPLEFFSVLLLSYLIMQLLFRKKKYAYGQVMPMLFIPLAPVMVLFSSLFLDITIWGDLQVGRHPWYIVAGVAVLSLYISLINIRTVMGRMH